MLKSYSSQKQDLYAYYLLPSPSTFLDLGCWDPTHCNNTYLLENQFGWNGLLFDTNQGAINRCNAVRASRAFCVDTQTADFIKTLEKNWNSKHFDYISLDVDDASLPTLTRLLEAGYSFSCMTFEHDYYRLGNELKIPSIKILESYGYVRLFDNVITYPTHDPQQLKQYPDGQIFEDWWINPTAPLRYKTPTILSIQDNNIHYDNCIEKIKNPLKQHIAPK